MPRRFSSGAASRAVMPLLARGAPESQPDQAVTAPEREREPYILHRPQVVGVGVSSRFVEPAEDDPPPAVWSRRRRARRCPAAARPVARWKICLVVDHAARVSTRSVEIDDYVDLETVRARRGMGIRPEGSSACRCIKKFEERSRERFFDER